LQSLNEGETPAAEIKFHIKNRTEENWESSEAAKSLKRMQENDRIKYIVILHQQVSSACQQLAGTYPKDQVPRLPIEYCFGTKRMQVYYLPYLGDLYP
jgi:hypothetical protein